MFVRMPCIIIALKLLALVAGQQEADKIFGTILREDFFFTENNNNDPEPHGHLRRQLQQASCRPLHYEAKSGDCSGTYPCTCNGVTTECPYCAVHTTSVAGTVCQQSGTSSTFTFSKDDSALMTCTCNYYGSGAAVSTCGLQTRPELPPELPVLPVPTPTPAPTPEDRVPGVGGSNPSPGVPVDSVPLVPLGCNAFWASASPRICIGSPEQCPLERVSCSLLGQHPCACTGSSDTTMCSYCQVQTATEMFCQLVGSAVTITAPNGSLQTCTCDNAARGQTIQSCTPVSETP